MSILDEMDAKYAAYQQEQSDANVVQDESPSWLSSHLGAASVHNTATGGFSFWDSSTWSDTADNIANMAKASFLSGVNSYYNTAGAIGGLFGYDFKQRDTGAWIAELDSDLGRYYEQNRAGADFGGFLLGSLIPGLAGVKVLNMGQKVLKAAEGTGFIGENLARATGLMNNALDRQIVLAATELANKQAVFTYTTANALKAAGSGVVQAAWETAAFEVAVNATMFKSPVLEQQSYEDIAKNLMWGTVFGGVIGGAVNVAKLKTGVDKALSKADEILMPVSYVSQPTYVRNASDKAVAYVNDIERIQAATFPAENGLVEAATFETRRANTLASLRNSLRETLHEVAHGDKELANVFADNLKGIRAFDASTSLWNLQESGRLGTLLKHEQKTQGLVGKIQRMTASRDSRLAEIKSIYERNAELLVMDDETVKALRTAKMHAGKSSKMLATAEADLAASQSAGKVLFSSVHGADAGLVSTELPKVYNVADVVQNQREVLATYNKTRFSLDRSTASLRDHLEAEALYWHGSKYKFTGKEVLAPDNIPALEGAMAALSSGRLKQVVLSDGTTLTTQDALVQHLKNVKEEVAGNLLRSGLSSDEVAKIVNVRRSLLEGDVSSEVIDDYFAHQTYSAEYAKRIGSAQPVDTRFIPSVFKSVYDTSTGIEANSGHLADAMASIEATYKLRQESVLRAVAQVAGDPALVEQLRPFSKDALLTANRLGSQPGMLSFNDAAYFTLGSEAQNLGKVTQLLERNLLGKLGEDIGSSIERLRANPAAARELSALNARMAATGERYVVAEGGMKLAKLVEYEQALQAGKKARAPSIPQGIPHTIPVENADTLQAIRDHIVANDRYVKGRKLLAAAEGTAEAQLNGWKEGVYYPLRKDYRDFKHYAFVVDDSVTGYGHVSMLHAKDAQSLEALITKANGEGFRTITDRQSKEWHKAIGDYDYSRTLNENHIDARLKARGIDSEWLPPTEPEAIVSMWEGQLSRQYRVLAKEAVRSANAREFAELERLGEQYTGIASSQYATSLKRIEDTVQNPYANYIKTALNIGTLEEHPLLVAANNTLDKAFSIPVAKVRELWRGSKSAEEIAQIGEEMSRYGIKSAYATAADILYANQSASSGELRKFVRTANGIIASLAIRTDPFNALTNSVSSVILTAPEVRSLRSAILAKGSKEAVAEFDELAKVLVPGAGGDGIYSSAKLMASAYKDFLGAPKEELLAFYKSRGWSPDILLQQRQVMEDLTLVGGEGSAQIAERTSRAAANASKLMEAAERYSGNRLAEELNRFVAARTADRLLDVGVRHGVIPASAKEAAINTFVNRTQGNMMASQRPLMFQGAVGSAMSLFQTYQFNFMQQLFRHVGEGEAKNAAMILGLQASVFGLNGLPAFNFINQSLVGNASGNTTHQDLYTGVYGMTGKQLGDWVMYGGLAALTGSNIYGRGDLNPRQLTILPSDLSEVPVVNASMRVFGNLKSTLSNVMDGGGVWQSFLQGLEHNGLSRPITGMAQIAQGMTGDAVVSTDSSSGLIASNDLLTLASLKRLAGGKPYDEAFTTDAMFRIKAYSAHDRQKLDALRERVRTQVINGSTPSDDAIGVFAEEYVKLGGKARNFNKFMLEQYKVATTPAAIRMEQQLKSPLSSQLQEFMGGRDLAAGDGETAGY